MQITLNQEEIVEAIIGYVHQQISVAPNQKIEVDLKAGRGEHGFTATLDIRSTSTVIPAATVATKEPASIPVEEPAPQLAPVKEEPKAAKTTKASGIFGKSIKAEAPAPLETSEPVNVLEDVLPQQDPENTAVMPEDDLGSELDDVVQGEDPPAATQPEAGVKSSSIFKFAKG